jgi:hypothetical protein
MKTTAHSDNDNHETNINFIDDYFISAGTTQTDPKEIQIDELQLKHNSHKHQIRNSSS